jgi:hypothetical protein
LAWARRLFAVLVLIRLEGAGAGRRRCLMRGRPPSRPSSRKPRRLRAEAEAPLADYKKKTANAADEAQAIVDAAKAAADRRG